jgi:hypothetical protein
MKLFSRVALVLGMAATMTAPALALDPSGVWAPDHTSDYEVTMCGKDNAQLCIRVIALRGAMDTKQNRPYLNEIIVNKAKAVSGNRWKGPMHLFGQDGEATVTLRGDNDLLVKVCAYVVICREYAMTRVQ